MMSRSAYIMELIMAGLIYTNPILTLLISFWFSLLIISCLLVYLLIRIKRLNLAVQILVRSTSLTEVEIIKLRVRLPARRIDGHFKTKLEDEKESRVINVQKLIESNSVKL